MKTVPDGKFSLVHSATAVYLCN